MMDTPQPDPGTHPGYIHELIATGRIVPEHEPAYRLPDGWPGKHESGIPYANRPCPNCGDTTRVPVNQAWVTCCQARCKAYFQIPAAEATRWPEMPPLTVSSPSRTLRCPRCTGMTGVQVGDTWHRCEQCGQTFQGLV